MWRAMSGSYLGDESPIKEFFLSIETGSFGVSGKKEVFNKYVDFAIDVVAIVVAFTLTFVGALALLLAFPDLLGVLVISITILVGSFFGGLIFSERIGPQADRRNRITVNTRAALVLTKVLLFISNVVIILAPAVMSA